MEFTPEDVTPLLAKWGKGDRAAFNKLIPVVYRELHKMAKRYMAAQAPGHTLQTTAIVNEAYLKLATGSEKNWANRAHFFAVAAKAMRHVLVDHARSSHAARRGGEIRMEALDEGLNIADGRPEELIRLDDALNILNKLHARQGEVVELRYFAGLSVEQTAEVLNVSPETVMRDWKLAKAFLYREMAQTS